MKPKVIMIMAEFADPGFERPIIIPAMVIRIAVVKLAKNVINPK